MIVSFFRVAAALFVAVSLMPRITGDVVVCMHADGAVDLKHMDVHDAQAGHSHETDAVHETAAHHAANKCTDLVICDSDTPMLPHHAATSALLPIAMAPPAQPLAIRQLAPPAEPMRQVVARGPPRLPDYLLAHRSIQLLI